FGASSPGGDDGRSSVGQRGGSFGSAVFAFRRTKMSRGLPSMTALLGLLAVAGYQNRDKISEWLGGLGQQSAPRDGRSRGPSGGLSGLLDQLSGSLAGATPGGILSGGLAELIDRFRQGGHGETAESWARTGPSQPVTPAQLQKPIGPDV